MTYPVERNLTNHPPTNDVDIADMESVREAAKTLARAIDVVCPESREKSLAFTNLEQTTMWAIASIARDGH